MIEINDNFEDEDELIRQETKKIKEIEIVKSEELNENEITEEIWCTDMFYYFRLLSTYHLECLVLTDKLKNKVIFTEIKRILEKQQIK